LNKGRVLLALGRVDEAKAILQKAARKHPKNAEVLAGLGLAFRYLDNDTCALKALDRALQLDPDNAWALSTRGDLLCDIGEYEKAVLDLSRAIEIGPPEWRKLHKKGWALENMGAGRAQEAKKAYEAALELEPDVPDDQLWAHRGLARALRLLGDTEGAQAEYKWVIDQTDKLAEEAGTHILALAGWCLYQLGHYEEAVQRFVAALSIDSDIMVQFELALVLLCMGDHEMALQEYRWGLEQARAQPVLRRRGLLHVTRDDLEEAIQAQPSLDSVLEAREVRRRLRDAYHTAWASTPPECRHMEWLATADSRGGGDSIAHTAHTVESTIHRSEGSNELGEPVRRT
jgi:tetratricopeptide (TPR) repeat protein